MRQECKRVHLTRYGKIMLKYFCACLNKKEKHLNVFPFARGEQFVGIIILCGILLISAGKGNYSFLSDKALDNRRYRGLD